MYQTHIFCFILLSIIADHTSFAIFTGHQLSRGFFEAPGVDNAVNPYPAQGYFHGPVVNPNPNQKPAAQYTAQAAGNPRYNITAADIDNVNDQPLNPRLTLSKMNLLVCPVVEIVPIHQCGITFKTQPDFRRHLRIVHSGYFQNPDRKPISRLEKNKGHLALVKYIRSGDQRNNHFMNELDRGPVASIVGYQADCMSTIARNNNDQCDMFGLLYYRDQQPVALTSGGRSRRRGQNPPPSPILFVNLTQLNTASNAMNPPDEDEEDEDDTDADNDSDTDNDTNNSDDYDQPQLPPIVLRIGPYQVTRPSPPRSEEDNNESEEGKIIEISSSDAFDNGNNNSDDDDDIHDNENSNGDSDALISVQ